MTKKRPRKPNGTPEAFADAAECLRTLAHPVRLRMVQLLLHGRYTVGELAEDCDVPNNVASEHLRLSAGPGTRVVVGQQIPPARVIDELSPEIWIRSDRAGLQMMARVVLPRSPDPASGRPMTTYVIGDLHGDFSKIRYANIWIKEK